MEQWKCDCKRKVGKEITGALTPILSAGKVEFNGSNTEKLTASVNAPFGARVQHSQQLHLNAFHNFCTFFVYYFFKSTIEFL